MPALVLALGLFAAHALAQGRLTIVATTTDLRSLVEAVGGDRVQATSLVPPAVDAEAYQPRPQDIARLKDARLVVRVGLDYDLWFDRLLRQAGNAALMRGADGYVDASGAIALLDVRGTTAGPQGGHAHGSGNPHYWLDPTNAEFITGALLEAMARLDPPNAKFFEARRTAFLGRLALRMRTWEAALAGMQGKPLLAYHNSWAYLARRFRLHVAGTIEAKAGIPPSPAHLAALVRTMNEMKIRMIVKQPFEPAQYPDFLAAKTGAKVVVLAASVGAVPEATDYLALFDYNVKALSGG